MALSPKYRRDRNTQRPLTPRHLNKASEPAPATSAGQEALRQVGNLAQQRISHLQGLERWQKRVESNFKQAFDLFIKNAQKSEMAVLKADVMVGRLNDALQEVRQLADDLRPGLKAMEQHQLAIERELIGIHTTLNQLLGKADYRASLMQPQETNFDEDNTDMEHEKWE